MKRLTGITKLDLQPCGLLPDGVPSLYPPFGEFKQWKVKDAFRYITRHGFVVPVPADFFTDLASVPRLLRAIFGVNHKESLAAVIHDFGYRNNKKQLRNILGLERRALTRKEWDEVFSDVMAYGGTPTLRRVLFWSGVRMFGGFTKNWRKKK